MKKKVISALCATTMLLAGGITLTACNKDTSEAKVMNVSLNPEVEFVLDKDNKVVSVNALNNEGNIIISGDVEFVGKDATEAAQLFVSISKDNGYLVSGSVTTEKNKLEIQISGEQTKEIEKLFNSVKTSVESKLQELNITGTIEKLENLTKEYLQGVVAECAPYLEEAKIKAMEYSELIEEIKTSRKETKELYSQELKEMYYQAKSDALRLAQLEKVKEQIGALSAGLLTEVEKKYTDAINAIEKTRKDIFLDADGVYQKAVKAFNEAKTDYLKRRKEISEMDSSLITDEVKQGLADLDKLVEGAENALEEAYKVADGALTATKDALTGAYNGLKNVITGLGASLDVVSADLTSAINDFTTKFESDYATYKNQANAEITNFKNKVKNTTTTQD